MQGELLIADIQRLFLVFAAVVLLFIVVKWVFLWRRIQRGMRHPQVRPENEKKKG